MSFGHIVSDETDHFLHILVCLVQNGGLVEYVSVSLMKPLHNCYMTRKCMTAIVNSLLIDLVYLILK